MIIKIGIMLLMISTFETYAFACTVNHAEQGEKAINTSEKVKNQTERVQKNNAPSQSEQYSRPEKEFRF